MKLAALLYPFENTAVEAWEVLYVAPSWTLVLIKYERMLPQSKLVSHEPIQREKKKPTNPRRIQGPDYHLVQVKLAIHIPRLQQVPLATKAACPSG